MIKNNKLASTAQKRKREDSTSSTGTNDQQMSSTQSSGNEAKKVKLEQTQESVKEQPPIPNGQLPGQQSQSLQALSLIKKDQTTTTQNSSVQQQSSSQPSSVNTTSVQTTPKLQTPAASTATTSNSNPIPPQVIQIPPNILAQTQQPVKITNQAAPNNVTTLQLQSTAPTSSAATISRPPQRPAFASQQAIQGSLFRPQQNIVGAKIPNMHAQLQARLAAMTSEQRKQYFTALQQPILRNNPHLLRNALSNNANAQQLSNQLIQNTLLQHELAASQQNLANVLVRRQLGQTMLQNGAQIQQQIGNFVTSAAPISEAVSTQALTGFGTSAAINAAQLGAFNTSTAPTNSASAQSVGYTTTSSSVGTINTQFGGNATNNAQIPASTVMNSISATGMNNVVAGQTAISINGSQVRPNLPQKKVNALWSGHITWSVNNQGQKRELTCQVTAFPKKTAPTSQID
jgi:hypothetical protein